MKRILLALIAATVLSLQVPTTASARPYYYRGWGPGYYGAYYRPRAYVQPYRVYRPVVRPYNYYYNYPYAGGYYGTYYRGPGYYAAPRYYYW